MNADEEILAPPRALTSRTSLGFAAATLVVLCWSGFNIVSRLGGRSVLTPFDLVALRFGVSGLVLSPMFLRLDFAATKLQLLVLTLFGGIGYSLLIYSGFFFAPAAHAAIVVNGGIPFATLIVGWTALGMRPGRRALMALAIAGFGIALIGLRAFLHGTGGSGREWLGDLLFLASAGSFATFGLLMKRWHVRPVEATTGVSCISMLLYLPVYALLLPKALAAAPMSLLVLQGVYQGVIAASFAGLLYTYANMAIGPLKASLMLALVPGISALAAVPLLGEELDAATVAGVLLVTAGAILGATGRHAESGK